MDSADGYYICENLNMWKFELRIRGKHFFLKSHHLHLLLTNLHSDKNNKYYEFYCKFHFSSRKTVLHTGQGMFIYTQMQYEGDVVVLLYVVNLH
jgi:hypothetical protein